MRLITVPNLTKLLQRLNENRDKNSAPCRGSQVYAATTWFCLTSKSFMILKVGAKNLKELVVKLHEWKVSWVKVHELLLLRFLNRLDFCHSCRRPSDLAFFLELHRICCFFTLSLHISLRSSGWVSVPFKQARPDWVTLQVLHNKADFPSSHIRLVTNTISSLHFESILTSEQE